MRPGGHSSLTLRAHRTKAQPARRGQAPNYVRLRGAPGARDPKPRPPRPPDPGSAPQAPAPTPDPAMPGSPRPRGPRLREPARGLRKAPTGTRSVRRSTCPSSRSACGPSCWRAAENETREREERAQQTKLRPTKATTRRRLTTAVPTIRI